MPKLTKEMIEHVEAECLMLLSAERDCYHTWRTSGRIDAYPVSGWETAAGRTGGYYSEAFGIMRALVSLGYCYFGPNAGGDQIDQTDLNANRWFDRLKDVVIAKEIELAPKPGEPGIKEAYAFYNEAFIRRTSKLFPAQRQALRRAAERAARMGPHDIHDPGDELGLK